MRKEVDSDELDRLLKGLYGKSTFSVNGHIETNMKLVTQEVRERLMKIGGFIFAMANIVFDLDGPIEKITLEKVDGKWILDA